MDGGIQIELLERVAGMVDFRARQQRESRQQPGGFRAAMGFHHPHQHIESVQLPLPGKQQHGIGLAPPRTHASQNSEPPALFHVLLAPQPGEQVVGIGAGVVGHDGGMLEFRHLKSCDLGQGCLADIKGEEFLDSENQRVRDMKNIE